MLSTTKFQEKLSLRGKHSPTHKGMGEVLFLLCNNQLGGVEATIVVWFNTRHHWFSWPLAGITDSVGLLDPSIHHHNNGSRYSLWLGYQYVPYWWEVLTSLQYFILSLFHWHHFWIFKKEEALSLWSIGAIALANCFERANRSLSLVVLISAPVRSALYFPACQSLG